MITINLQSLHTVFCKNLQLKLWWWLRFTLRGSLSELSQLLARRICPRVLRMITSITDELDFSWDLVSVRFSMDGFDHFYCLCLSKFTIDCSSSVKEACPSSDLMHDRRFPDTIMDRLRCFVWGAHTRQGRVFTTRGKWSGHHAMLHALRSSLF